MYTYLCVAYCRLCLRHSNYTSDLYNLTQTVPVEEALDGCLKPPRQCEGVELPLYLSCNTSTQFPEMGGVSHAQFLLIEQIQE